MTYQELSEVRKTLRVEWYRSPTQPGVLRELSRRSDAQAWFLAGGHVALFIITASLVFGFWWNEQWLGFLIALFFHGTVTSFFKGNSTHELGHGTVFKTKWLNKVFLYLFSLIGWWDPFDYASSHTYHHRYTLHPEGDREVLLPVEPSLASAFMLQLFTVNLLTQPGRIFGKGGLISTVISLQWRRSVVIPRKTGARQRMVAGIAPRSAGRASQRHHVVAHPVAFPWVAAGHRHRDRAVGAAIDLFRLRVHCQLATVFRQLAAALRLAR